MDKNRAVKRTESTTPMFNMDEGVEGLTFYIQTFGHFALRVSLILTKFFIGYNEERSLLMSQKSLEKRFGQSLVFIAATFMVMGDFRLLCILQSF